MRKIILFHIFFLLNLLVLSAGGPNNTFSIINLSGEPIYFTFNYNSTMFYVHHREGMNRLLNRNNYLTPNRNPSREGENSEIHYLWSSFPNIHILSDFTSKLDIRTLIRQGLIELNIYNNNGVLLFTKDDIAAREFFFVPDEQYDEYGTGTYYFCVTINDIRKPERRFTHRTIERLNLRERDSISSPIIKTLSNGEGVTALRLGNPYVQYMNNWIRVRTSDGTEGWCVSIYLVPF